MSGSYRRALAETVHHYSGWRPGQIEVDALKSEGLWNNDWEASLELLRRHGHEPLPSFGALVEVFSQLYFGGDPDGPPEAWQGFIREESLLVQPPFFEQLSQHGFAWGFVSGAEPASARFVLHQRLGLPQPPLIAMGDAPDKPDPTGLLTLAARLATTDLGHEAPLVAYVGDTVADVETVQRARACHPDQAFVSLAVAPPHLQDAGAVAQRQVYEHHLTQAGADHILTTTAEAPALLNRLLG